MLNNVELIEKLTLDQKLELLVNGRYLSAKHDVDLGLPSLVIKYTDDVITKEQKNDLPSLHALANTWDANNFENVYSKIGEISREQGVNALLLPNANVRSNVYSNGVSEDPLLCGDYFGAIANGVQKQGVEPVLTACSINKKQANYMDIEPDAKAIMEYYFKPFKLAIEKCPDAAATTNYTYLSDNYKNINVDIVKGYIGQQIGPKFLVCENVYPEYMVQSISNGECLTLKGRVKVLREAVKRYDELRESVELGVTSAEEMDNAVRDGLAISLDTIDEAVDKVIEFLVECASLPVEEQSVDFKKDNAGLKLAQDSVVLLKNKERVLPIIKRSKIAVLGSAITNIGGDFQAELSGIMKECKMTYLGYNSAYEIDGKKDEKALNEALQLATKADVVLMFVGFSEDKEKVIDKVKSVELPASQIDLIKKLKAKGKKVITIITGSGRVDIAFSKYVDGILYAPNAGKYSSQALARILVGKVSPSGKLPFTIYKNADKRFAKDKYYKDCGYNKIGSFVGYRRYVSDKEHIRYPFGYGLSYTSFQYSGFTIKGDEIIFSIKNVGKYDCSEIVQFYYEVIESKEVRPKKQLYRYEKIWLKAGQRKTIRTKINPKQLEIFNTADKKWKVEQGKYLFSVGSSVADTRLKGLMLVKGEEIKESKQDIVDYLQSKSNIVSGGYYMDTKIEKPKYKATGKRFGIATIIIALMCNLFVIFAKMFLKIFTTPMIWMIVYASLFVVNLLMVIGIIAIIVSAVRKRRYIKRYLKEWLDKHSTDEEAHEPVGYELLFIEEFDKTEDDEEDEDANFVIEDDVDDHYVVGLKLDTLQEKLISFALERGFVIDLKMAREILSAMSVSRMILFKTNGTVDTSSFMSMLSEFFGCPNYIDDAVDYTTPDDLLFNGNEQHGYAPTNLIDLLERADSDKEAINIYQLNNVKLENLGNYFMGFMRYLVKPSLAFNIGLKDQSISNVEYPVNTNIWFMAAVEDYEQLENVPAYIAETSAVVCLTFAITDTSDEKSPAVIESVAQFNELGDKMKNSFELTENYWRKLDKLEEYVAYRAKYRISNKLWQKLERFVAVYIGFGGSADEALSSALSTKVLPTMIRILIANKNEGDEQFVHVLENIFGEENADACRTVVNFSSLDAIDGIAPANKKRPIEQKESENEEFVAKEQVQEVVEEQTDAEEIETVPEKTEEQSVVEEQTNVVEKGEQE